MRNLTEQSVTEKAFRSCVTIVFLCCFFFPKLPVVPRSTTAKLEARARPTAFESSACARGCGTSDRVSQWPWAESKHHPSREVATAGGVEKEARESERVDEQIVDVPMPQSLRERIVEQGVDLPVPQIWEDVVEVVQTVPHERISEPIVELIVIDVQVPQSMKESGDVVRILQERISESIVEQTVEVPAPQVGE